MYVLVIISFLMAGIFFVFERITMKRFKIVESIFLKEMEYKPSKAGLLLPIYKKWAILNLFSLFVACGSLLAGLIFSIELIKKIVN